MPGYAGRILVCDLSTQRTLHTPTSDYAHTFLGGRGLAARLYWQLKVNQLSAYTPENPLIVATGPLAGFAGLSGSRWQVCTKSPSVVPESFSYSNLGGSWGARLKFAGFDALAVTGRAEKPAYLFIHDGICELRDAADLWGLDAVTARESLTARLGQGVKVLTTGPAGENMVPFAIMLADYDSSASAGLGAVMGAKNLKAIAVAPGKGQIEAAEPDKLRRLTRFLRQLKEGEPQETPVLPRGATARRQACLGCTAGCSRSLITAADGHQGKYLCTSGFFYEDWAQQYYGELNEVPFRATRLCDAYGLDANVIYTMIRWLSRCYEAGIISDENTGLHLSRMGSLEFVDELIRKTALREDFGDVLAAGMPQAAQKVGLEAMNLVHDSVFRDGSYTAYCPRVYITNALNIAFEPRQSFPISGEVGRTVLRWLDGLNEEGGAEETAGKTASSPHLPAGRSISDDDLKFIARRFWGSEAAADLTITDGKAMAAKMIQDRHYVKESAVLCNFSWHVTSIEHFRPEIVAELLSAVTGGQYDEPSIYSLGERIFNLHRAIYVHERGQGRDADTIPEVWHTTPVQEAFMNPELLVPGSDGRPVTRRGSVLDRNVFESLKDEYYRLRGWHVSTGLQTEAKLSELGLGDVAGELKQSGLIR